MTDRIVLADGYSFSTDPKETGLNNNVAVIGCTGSGKTCSVVIPRLLNTYNTNLILTDPKGELYDTFLPVFRSRGYNVLKLNLDSPSESEICFDLLRYAETSEDISRLASAITNAVPQHGDLFWTNAQNVLTELIMRYVLQFKENPTFADFLLASRSVESVETSTSSLARLSIAPLLDEFEKTHPRHPLTSSYRNMHDIAGKTLASVFISMRSTLANYFNTEVEKMLQEKPNFDIDSFIAGKSVLFIETDGTDEGTNIYLNLIYEALIRSLMKKAKEFPGGVLPIPVHIIMDDFACGAKIASFPQLLSTFRSKGISSTIILQDESQLYSMYGQDETKTILNNNDTLVYLGGNDLNTAKDISNRLNIPLDDVLYMPLNSLVFFRRGSRPVKAARYPLFSNPEYLELISKKENGPIDGPEK